jgi:1-acyl-sn-glycerol-3-phosphate acyltransferase
VERVDRVEDDWWWRFGLATLGSIARAAFRLRFEGLDHLPDAGPALLACNHVSVLDPVIVALGPSERGRTVRFLAAEEFFRRPFVGWGLRRIRQIPIRRGASDWAALQEVANVIRRGALAGIFPEGQLGNGPLQRGRRGAARIALAGQVPVVPLAIWGTQRRWPRSGLQFTGPLRLPVATVFGPSIDPVGDARDQDAVQALTDRVMAAIRRCLDRAQSLAGS